MTQACKKSHFWFCTKVKPMSKSSATQSWCVDLFLIATLLTECHGLVYKLWEGIWEGYLMIAHRFLAQRVTILSVYTSCHVSPSLNKVDWLTDWLLDLLTDWFIDWLIDWLIDQLRTLFLCMPKQVETLADLIPLKGGRNLCDHCDLNIVLLIEIFVETLSVLMNKWKGWL